MNIIEILAMASTDLPYVREELDPHRLIADLRTRIKTEAMTPDQQARNQLLLDMIIRNLKK